MQAPRDVFGLMAYLFVAYGGFPPPELVSAAWDGSLDQASRPNARSLSLVPDTGRSVSSEVAPKKRRAKRSQPAAA